MPPRKHNDYYDEKDEIITVTLSKGDYIIMREIIDRQKSLNWIGKYFRNVIYVTVSGLLLLIAFGEQIKALFTKILGG